MQVTQSGKGKRGEGNGKRIEGLIILKQHEFRYANRRADGLDKGEEPASDVMTMANTRTVSFAIHKGLAANGKTDTLALRIQDNKTVEIHSDTLYK